MNELCSDNRFELIEKYKTKLIESTNIETSLDEMSVLDSILFRFWQMGWLDKLEQPIADVRENEYGEWIKMDKRGNNVRCSKCGNTLDLRGVNAGRGDANYCPNCGRKMR